MQYDERETKPESPLKFLIQQVEEQSTVCDVTVKMGQWVVCDRYARRMNTDQTTRTRILIWIHSGGISASVVFYTAGLIYIHQTKTLALAHVFCFNQEKKFHRCVLIVNPFFDRALQDNFLEKQTGNIKMKVGTPATIDMAIMFLYGRIPKLTPDNIEHMMVLAEFLLIPNLKSACISWLKAVTITGENCMNLLQISSIYDFELPSCTDYLFGHMPEMLQRTQTNNLSKDSVQYLFSDKKLSYVPMDDKVNFLIRWANDQPAKRINSLKELFLMVDFNEVCKAVLDELKKDQIVRREIDLEDICSSEENKIPHKHRVLIMKTEKNYPTFRCLDLDREQWFQLKPEVFRDWSTIYFEISGARTVSSDIYLTQTNQEQNILILNLEDDLCKTYKLVHEDNGNDFINSGDICFDGSICIAYENKGLEDDSKITNRYMEISTLYIGDIKDEKIMMSPVLSFKDDTISNICINDMLTLAIVLDSREAVSLFDLADYKIETIQLKTENDDRIVQSDDGFIIYNNKRCICLSRIIGPSMSCKFGMKEISFENQSNYNKYIFCWNTWYHYCCKDQIMFESASHSDMLLKSSVKDVAWKKLPLPKEEKEYNSSTIKDSLFQICLTKNKLRCDIECPHCTATDTEFSDDSDVSDDSDDSCPEYYSDYSDYGFLF